MSYINEPFKKFITDLSSKLPAPGGGSAAALIGAVASSLNCMTANFTVGNEKYADVEKEVKVLLEKSIVLRDKLLILVQADIDVYNELTRVKKSVALSDAEKKANARITEEVTKKAAEVPFSIMKECFEILLICEVLLVKGNKYLVTDVGVAAVAALAAIKSAYLNVKINFLYLQDEAYKSKIESESSKTLLNSIEIERKVLEECHNKIKR